MAGHKIFDECQAKDLGLNTRQSLDHSFLQLSDFEDGWPESGRLRQ